MSSGEEAPSLPVYTWDDISRHNTEESLWVVIEGQVYDVTQFQEEHPGGREVLLENAARDATGAFIDVGHSNDAIELRKKYLIGVVGSKSTSPKGSAQSAAARSTTAAAASSAVSRAKEVAVTVLPVVVVAGLAIGLGFLLYRRCKK